PPENGHVDRWENGLRVVGGPRRVEEGVANGDAAAGVGLDEAAGRGLEGMEVVEVGDVVADEEEAAGEDVGADAGAGGVEKEEAEVEEEDGRNGDAETEAAAVAGDAGVVGSAWGGRWTSSPGRRLVMAYAATYRADGMLSSCWSVRHDRGQDRASTIAEAWMARDEDDGGGRGGDRSREKDARRFGEESGGTVDCSKGRGDIRAEAERSGARVPPEQIRGSRSRSAAKKQNERSSRERIVTATREATRRSRRYVGMSSSRRAAAGGEHQKPG
ncbi:hypothetical protein FALBO_10268, partial [Fusarium albosuccineum]